MLAQVPDSPLAPLMRAHLAIARGDLDGAARHLAAAPGTYGVAAALDSAIGHAYLRIERWDEAARAFRSAIAVDATLAQAHEGLAWASLGQRHPEEAAEKALDAIRLRYDSPDAHQVLGIALNGLGRTLASKQALATSQALRPRTPTA